MYSLLMTLLLISAVLLIVVVLIQPAKGDMMSNLGSMGGSFTSVFGAKGGLQKLHKTTIFLALFIVVLTVSINIFALDTEEEIRKPAIEGTSVPTAANPIVPKVTNQPIQVQENATPKEAEKK